MTDTIDRRKLIIGAAAVAAAALMPATSAAAFQNPRLAAFRRRLYAIPPGDTLAAQLKQSIAALRELKEAAA